LIVEGISEKDSQRSWKKVHIFLLLSSAYTCGS